MRVRSQRWVAGRRVDAERLHLAAAAVPETLEDLDGGGLAGAVRSEQGEHFALLHLEADVAHGHVVAVGLGQMSTYYGRTIRPPLPSAAADSSPTT